MTDLLELPGIGKKTAVVLNKMGIYTVNDLVMHFPRRYEMHLQPVLPGEVTEGKQAVIGTVRGKFYDGKNGMVSLNITDQSGSIKLVWFHNRYIDRMLEYNRTYVFCGNVSWFNGKASMTQPSFYPYEEYQGLAGTIMPIYPLRKGMTNSNLFRYILEALVEIEEFPDFVPEDVCQTYGLISKRDAIRCIHYPADWDVLELARKRLVFEEFYKLMYSVRYRAFSRGENIFSLQDRSDLHRAIDALPYELTGSQRVAIDDICKDLSGFRVSNRLIQGDVGCGKTAVALLAMIHAASNGYQAVLMAPTEVLATQHYKEAEKLLDLIDKKDQFAPVLLTGSMKEKEKKIVREQIETGKSLIAIGTHALIQEKTNYHNLVLTIIDEQHRFGVEQREALAGKSNDPIHSIIMTATPIHRTTGSILFGGMDVTVMKDKPAKRLPIKSCMAMPSMRKKVYDLIWRELSDGRQAYVICPMVEEDQDGGKKSVESYQKQLMQVFPSVETGILHGKMDSAEKQRQMNAFASLETKILVATTVVEVGVNVPNATVILIENADMFGMLQLHQLRGRVGRGSDQSYCVFMSSKEEPNEKLDILSKTEDGFEIAEADYRMRKAGNLLGTKQSGDMGFKLADMVRDEAILRQVEEAIDQKFPK